MPMAAVPRHVSKLTVDVDEIDEVMAKVARGHAGYPS
jgi:hypothetical protein